MSARPADKPEESVTSRRSAATRWVLAGPVALATAVLVMAGMPVWVPEGSGSVDHLAFPLILFPAIWTALFFYAVLESNMRRAAAVMLALLFINAVPVIMAASDAV